MSCCCPTSDDQYDEVDSKTSDSKSKPPKGAPELRAPSRQSIDRSTATGVKKKNQGKANAVAQQPQGTPSTQISFDEETQPPSDGETLKIIELSGRQISDLTFGDHTNLIRPARSFESEAPLAIRRPDADDPLDVEIQKADSDTALTFGCLASARSPPRSSALQRPDADEDTVVSIQRPQSSPNRNKSILDAKEGFERFIPNVGPAEQLRRMAAESGVEVEETIDGPELSHVAIPLPEQLQTQNVGKLTSSNIENNPLVSVPSQPYDAQTIDGTSSVGHSSDSSDDDMYLENSRPTNQALSMQEEWKMAAIRASQLPDPSLIRTESNVHSEEKKIDDSSVRRTWKDDFVAWKQRSFQGREQPSEEPFSQSSQVSMEESHVTDEALLSMELPQKYVGSSKWSQNSYVASNVSSNEGDSVPTESDLFSEDTGAYEARSQAGVEVIAGFSENTQVTKTDIDDQTDALSDLPSDVDSETRMRYLAACRLLKTNLIKKERTQQLSSSDLAMLKDLLGAERENRTPSPEELAAVETASETINEQAVIDIRSALLKAKGEMTSDFSARRKTSFASQRRAFGSRSKGPSSVKLSSAKPTLSNVVLGRVSAGTCVLTTPIMQGLRECLPDGIRESNFWLKHSSDQDSGALPQLLPKIQFSNYTIIGVETKKGDVFGAFCSSPWRVGNGWYGSEEAFLWRLKHPRLRDGKRRHDVDNELEVYTWCGNDKLIQNCTEKTLAVGGGKWAGFKRPGATSEPVGIGFCLDYDLFGGETSSCSTFGNPPLCNTIEFDVVRIEVWTLTPYKTLEKAEEGEQLDSLTAESF